jgi:hypothetical protein
LSGEQNSVEKTKGHPREKAKQWGGVGCLSWLALSVTLVMIRKFSTAAASARRVVFVDGVRTPFKLSGTDFKDYIAQDLGRMAIKGLLTKTAINPSEIDYTLYGTVIQEGASSLACRRVHGCDTLPLPVPNAAESACCCVCCGHPVLPLAAGVPGDGTQREWPCFLTVDFKCRTGLLLPRLFPQACHHSWEHQLTLLTCLLSQFDSVRTSNIARESALAAGIPDSVPAHTVTLACISSNVAISTGVMQIQTGQANVVVAGGAETMYESRCACSHAMLRCSSQRVASHGAPSLGGWQWVRG